jgi:hypothetical protein
VILIAVLSSGAQASTNPSRANAEGLTKALMALNAQYQAAPNSSKAQALARLQAVALKRQQLLSALMQTAPAEVLRVAIPATVGAQLVPGIQNLVEQETDATGELEVMYEDGPNTATLHHFIKTNGQRLELKFAAKTPTNLLTGSNVHVHGTKVGTALALNSGTSTSSFQVTNAAPLPNTFGAQNTLVILVNFQDIPTQPYTAASAQDVVFNQTSSFQMENSFQQSWLAGDVAGWFTIPINSTTCDTASIQKYADQAAQGAGYVLSNYQRFIYAFPQTSACSWLGYSYIGGNPSSSWINGSFQLQVVAHELGHAFGLYHSHGLSCGAAAYAQSGCTLSEYGDYYDVMGNSNPMDYNASQRERLGWLNAGISPPITTVTANGTYTLTPLETQDSTSKALKILQSASSNQYYYVEFRQAIGYDWWLSLNSPPNGFSYVLNGVLVHISNPSDANSSDLLNMNPAVSWGYDLALNAGQTYTDGVSGITIAPTAVSSAGATVQVTLANSGGSCTHANPAISVVPGQSPWVVSGTTVSFTVTLANNDSAGCGTSTFSLAASLPSGWSSSFSNSNLSLVPGTSGQAILQVTSPAGTADGFYDFSISGANTSAASFTTAATATYVISTPPPVTITVTTDKSIYSSNQNVIVVVTVLSGGTPDSGAAVSVTITPPKGGVTLLSGTTNSAGVASLSYTLKKKAMTGTYKVQANMSGSSGSAQSSFAVQ